MDKDNYVSQTEAKQRLSELVKRVAYGGERIVLEFRGKPQAALVSMADLEALERAAGRSETTPTLMKVSEPVAEYVTGAKTRLDEVRSLSGSARALRALEEMKIIAERASARRGGAAGTDVAKDIEEMREERAGYLADLS